MSSVDKNNWNKHMKQHVENVCSSVKVLERVSQEEYDNLLNKNIVFLNLVDASAVNTIIECIVRNTPIVVNKIAAVVELLGENYPLYYYEGDINKQVSNLIIDTRNLKAAHKYLLAMDKTKFTAKYFVSDLTQNIKNIGRKKTIN